VVLAQLHAPVPPAADLADLRGVAPGGQHVRQGGDPGLRLPRPDDLRRGGADQVRDALGGETVERLLARVRGEEAQRRDGEVVVAVPEPGPPGVGEQVVPGRAPPTRAGRARCVAQLGLFPPRSARPDAGGPQAPTAPARRDRAAVHGPCSISSRATAVRVRPSVWPASAAAAGPASAPGPRRRGRVRTGPGAAFHNTSVTYIR
jgi:hypothetical protein